MPGECIAALAIARSDARPCWPREGGGQVRRALANARHSPGHISLWRERDRTLIAGDVASMIDFIRHGLAVGLLPSSFVAGINDISVVVIQRFAARRRRSTPDRGYPRASDDDPSRALIDGQVGGGRAAQFPARRGARQKLARTKPPARRPRSEWRAYRRRRARSIPSRISWSPSASSSSSETPVRASAAATV